MVSTFLIVIIVGGIVLAGVSQLRGQSAPEFSADVVAQLSGGNTEGFARVLAPKEFTFPADHGPHPEYQTEWWYTTANVATKDGRRFGIKLTIFRRALAPTPAERASEWGADQIYFADFAIADIQADQFIYTERFARGAAGLAGAEMSPNVRIFLENWSITFNPDGSGYRLIAKDAKIGLDMQMTLAKPIVLQGERGFSPKSSEPGNASYYYSMTRLRTEGTITVKGEQFEVSGTAWMDREYSTSVLAADALGWDWFALQLDDGREIMLYQIRKADGTVEATSDGTFVNADGSTVRLIKRNGDYTITPLGTWTSPRTGAVYPHGWKLTINAPDGPMELTVTPLMRDQELNTTTAYYEGASRITGTQNGNPITGYAYVELTGYNVQTARNRESYNRQ
jgi:predicted secreted hydrolase